MSALNEDLKQLLLAEQERLREITSRRDTNEERGSGCGNHMADDATETFEQAKGVSLRRSEEAMLDQIEYALCKFEEGTYGICESCGGPIDRARLQALPYAVYCIECQIRLEQGARG